MKNRIILKGQIKILRIVNENTINSLFLYFIREEPSALALTQTDWRYLLNRLDE